MQVRLKDNVRTFTEQGCVPRCRYCGALSIPELQKKAKNQPLLRNKRPVEGGAHDVMLKERQRNSKADKKPLCMRKDRHFSDVCLFLSHFAQAFIRETIGKLRFH